MPAIYDSLDKEFLNGVYSAAQSIGFDTLVFTSASTENSDSYANGDNNIYQLPFLADINGIIIAATRFHDLKLKADILKRLEKSKIPCVSIEESHRSIKGVFINQEKCIYDITQHLISCHRYKDILCLTGPEGNGESEERAAGYLHAMDDNGLSAQSRVIYGDFWHEAAINLARDISTGKTPRPRAIVCTNDIMAIKLCQELPQYGIRVPDDIAVTGYDGSLYTLVSKPAITTVCGCDLSLGRMAVKQLAQQLGIPDSIECGSSYIRYCRSCGCFNEEETRNALLKETELLLVNKLYRKPLMLSNYIAKMANCETIAKFTSVLDSLRYILYDCDAVNICLCEDWQKEHVEARKQGFTENIKLIYSENQPGEITFPLKKLLPQLNRPHEPQFWVFSSLHYFDKIMGYVATCYANPEKFTMDEYYIGWCDAVANGLHIVIKKTNIAKIMQKFEEKNMTDIYTGLLSRSGFANRLKSGDKAVMLRFPEDYGKMQYFIPIVSAVLRSQISEIASVYMGSTVFCIALSEECQTEFVQRLCSSVSELGIYITESKVNTATEEITDISCIEEQLQRMYDTLTEKNPGKNGEAYFDVFAELRREMKYSPNSSWSVSSAAEKLKLSGSHFQRLYKKYFGISFNEELIIFRNERAKYLLKNTSLPIKQIAEESGYTNAVHFMRQFKEREKMSAGQYRKSEIL